MKQRRAQTKAVLFGLTTLVCAGSVTAEPAVDAALLDWRPRAELPSQQQVRIPIYCEGGYLQPSYGRDGQLPRRDLLSADTSVLPVFAGAENSNYSTGPEGGVVELSGQVEIEQGNYWLSGSHAVYHEASQSAEVRDGVTVRGPSLLVTGDRAHYDANTGYFELSNGSYLVHDLELRGSADSISRPQPEQVLIENGVYTTCPPREEDWSLKASRILLDREEGFGTAHHAVLRVEDIPIFYVPYMTFPIDDRRKSGFLYPSVGTSNVGRGGFLSTPYYFNLAPNYDATYTPSYIHGRGLHSELEGRHLNEFSRTEARVGFIGSDDEFVREYPGSSAQRWGLDIENEITVGDNWYSELDFNAVSDDDYISDLARDLRISNDTHLERFWQLTYATENWAVQSLVQGFQTVDPVIADADRPYMRLPSLTFEGLWLTDDVEYELFSEYTYFWRNDENLTPRQQVKGNRLRFTPRVALPLQTVWGYFTPAVRLDHTSYLLDDVLPGEEDTLHRTVPFYTVDAGIYLDRSLSLLGKNLNQSLEPRLFYVYSPERDQDDYPLFDTTLSTFSYNQLFRDDRFSGGDRVGDNNRLTLGLTTRFTELETGIERARLSLGQVYYFDDRNVGLRGRVAETRSDSVLAGEALLRPSSLLDIKVEGLWDPREQRTEQGATTLRFHSPDYAYLLNLSHRYISNYREGHARPSGYLEQTDVSTIFPLTDRLSFIGRWLFNLPNHRTVGTLAGIEYRSCCWRLQVVAQSYLDDSDVNAPSELDRSIFVRFLLKGLSGLGAGSGSDLGEAIIGYEAREQYLVGQERLPSFYGP